MAVLSNPNGLALVSSLFLLSGAAVIGRAFIASVSQHTDQAHKERNHLQARIASSVGFPLLLVGLFAHACAQLGSVALNPLMVCGLLALAWGLLLYQLLEGSFVDAMSPRAAQPAEVTRLPVVHTPKLVEPIKIAADLPVIALAPG